MDLFEFQKIVRRKDFDNFKTASPIVTLKRILAFAGMTTR